ncbi:MAG: aldo/keto reductase [Candidatus Omnitrophica bacterium]|nr:aldo/keto reductase [Candidatus Omnitrophota bacterium]
MQAGLVLRYNYPERPKKGENMRYRKIGKTELEVSSICLGSWVFGGDCWGEVRDDQSVKVVREAIDRGVNFIDTAPIYGSGRSEKVIGRAIKGRRGDVVIATKTGLEQKGSSIRPNLSAGFIRQEIEGSLGRLGLDTIDLYQCHWPDPNTPLEETFRELIRQRDKGRIRYIGVSNFDKEILERALGILPVVSDQVQYSLFSRDIEKKLLPFCSEKGISILTYGSLGGGILTGKYHSSTSFPKGDVRSFFYKYYSEPFWQKAGPVLSVLSQIAEKRKVAVPEVAINWVLSHDEVASCIVGCRNKKQLEQNIKAADWQLQAEEIELIEGEYQKVFV